MPMIELSGWSGNPELSISACQAYSLCGCPAAGEAGPGRSGDGGAAPGADGEGEEDDGEVEGLAAYANEDVPEALLAAAAPAGGAPPRAENSGADPGWAAPDPAVAGVLRELGRVAAHRHLPAVKDWLRVLVKVPLMRLIEGGYHMCMTLTISSSWSTRAACRRQLLSFNFLTWFWAAATYIQGNPSHSSGLIVSVQVDVGEPGSAAHARRERLLRACIALRDQLAAATQRVEAVRPALDAAADADTGANPETPSNRAAGAAGPSRAAANAHMALLFGSSDEEEADPSPNPVTSAKPSHSGAGPGPAGRRAGGAAQAPDRVRAAGLSPAGGRAGGSAAGGRGAARGLAGRARAAASEGPVVPIVDPTERPRAPAAPAVSPAGPGRAGASGQAAAAASAAVGLARRDSVRGSNSAGALSASAAAAARKAALPETLKQKLLQSVRTSQLS